MKNRIKDIFGPNVLIKLDLFHGIQRIVKKVPKHSGSAIIKRLRKQLMKDLQLCFRKSSDVGDERKENTPPPTVIESNIGKFLVKWKNEEVENTKILSVSTQWYSNFLANGGLLSNEKFGLSSNLNLKMMEKKTENIFYDSQPSGNHNTDIEA